ncbi:MAG TPA: response regulator transcription factor [Bryobacteraceae bacterium]|jgi:two-component system NarL family response regulator|nr:response regulator transcription factor [Bryobacteraceae bacterium]
MKNAMAVSAPAVETPPVRIVIADDHLIARVGLVTIVNEQHDMTVVAEATNGQQAVALYRKLCPDVILMDLRMPVMDGFDAARAIRAEFPDARILALSTYSADEYIHRAFRAGVQAYLKKDVQHDDLIQAIRAVHSGQAPITASLVAQWPRPDLSARELEVLRLIAQGLSNKQIGYALSIAEYTVMNHVKSILGKLGADDRTQAATVAIHRGIIHSQD